mmetsp:Transcript_4091/g.18171  ORF Transcript_4091/g.18171 Transcript_4091/m.18171 type:complete len:274 (+) Transcript_4091:232-1053(+)
MHSRSMFAPFFPPPKRAIASASSLALSASTTGGSFDAAAGLAGTRVVPKAQSSQSAGVRVDSARRTSVPPSSQPSSMSAAVTELARTLWNQSAFAPLFEPPEPPDPNPSLCEPQSDPIAHADTARTPRLASPPSLARPSAPATPATAPTSPRPAPTSASAAPTASPSPPSSSSSPYASGPHHARARLFATGDRTSASVSHVITADETTRAGETTPAKTQRVSPAFSDPLDRLGAPPTASPGPARCAPATDTTSAPHESRGKTVRTLASGATAY